LRRIRTDSNAPVDYASLSSPPTPSLKKEKEFIEPTSNQNRINQQFRSSHISEPHAVKPTSSSKRVKVLFDYEASDDTELSVFANEVRFLSNSLVKIGF
jgi:hypothetical protein